MSEPIESPTPKASVLGCASALRAGRCGDRMPGLFASTPPVNCALLAGHAGWHRGDDGAEWVYADEPLPERSDLPVGQQSKGPYEPTPAEERAAADDWDACAAIANALLANAGKGAELWTDPSGDVVGSPLDIARFALKALDLPARVARVRAQVAEDIARDHELSERGQQEAAAAMRAEGLTEQARLHDHLAHAYGLAADRAREHAGKAFPCTPAALPDVVGTPEPDCPNCRRYGVPARVVHCGPGCHEAHTYVPPCELARHIADHSEAQDA